MAVGQRDDHHMALVARDEVVAERAVQVVAIAARRVDGAELGLRDTAEVARHGERDVRQRDLHELPLAGTGAMAVGGQQSDRRQLAHGDVPCRQHRVQRLGEVPRPRRPREAGGRVDGVVDLAGAVAVALEVDHDEVLAARAQRFVAQPAAGGEVGEEDARGRDHGRDELAALIGAQVDAQRPFALVETGPEQRLAVGRQRPARVVQAAAEIVEADDVGAELRERHPAQRRGDERRALHHRQPVEDPGHGISATRRQSRTSRASSSSPVEVVVTRRWTRPPSANGSQVVIATRECRRSPSKVGPEVVAGLPRQDRRQVRQARA